MSLKIYYDADIDEAPLSKKTVAIIGYGAQGRSHALNLRDSGVRVVIGQRPGPSFDRATEDGFSPVSIAAAAGEAEIVALMLPDEIQGPVFSEHVVGHLQPGDAILCCHGFSFLYGQVAPPEGIMTVLVAPKGAGHRVRSAFEAGTGVPCYVAVGSPERQESWQIALSYAKAIGGGRAGVMKTTFASETEADLFGEQAVLCGGVSHLAVAAFDTLVEAGYPAEMAYFECVHELKLVVELLHDGGMKHMREHISNTAEYGDYVSGPRIVDEGTRQRLRELLQEIQSGQFAKRWMADAVSGGFEFQALRAQHADTHLEQVGRRVQKIIRGEPVD